MNLGRFTSAIQTLASFLRPKPILTTLDSVIAALEAYTGSPTPETSASFRNTIDAFNTAVDKRGGLPSHPSFYEMVKEVGAEKYLPDQLKTTLRSMLSEKALTPVELLAGLRDLRKDLGEYVDKIQKLNGGLEGLKIEKSVLNENEYEFGALIPKKLVGETIEELTKELDHLHRLFAAMNELMGNGYTSPKIRTVSTSLWEIFLQIDMTQVAAVILAIERIVALYKSNLEIKKLRQDAAKKDLGAEITDLIDKRIQEKLTVGLREVASEIRLQLSRINDEARANELENQLRMELIHIAKRINQGASYEARAGLPVKPTEPTEEQKSDPALVQRYQALLTVYEERVQLAQKIDQVTAMELDLESGDAEVVLLMDYDGEGNRPGA